MLEGKKTYLMAVIMALMAFARGMGWLDQDQFEMLLAVAASMGLAALRAGISKAAE